MRPFDLICFDVDGTLVIHPDGKIVWEILNRRFTGDDTVNRTRFEQYCEGEISYADWVALDVGDWVRAGATRSQVCDAISDLRLIDHAHETLAELKRRGHKLAIISGTIDIVLDKLLPEHPFDDVFTNKVFFDESGLLCGWEPTPYDVDGKARALREIAEREGVSLERCAFVGDSFNDVEVARLAGFSIAFNPKCEELIEVSDVTLKGGSLEALLPFFPAAV
jgi:phosphoserine phosphatase